jgi:hypothetical protein
MKKTIILEYRLEGRNNILRALQSLKQISKQLTTQALELNQTHFQVVRDTSHKLQRLLSQSALFLVSDQSNQASNLH